MCVETNAFSDIYIIFVSEYILLYILCIHVLMVNPSPLVQSDLLIYLTYVMYFRNVLSKHYMDVNKMSVVCSSSMYWTDWGEDPRIERAGMDGSNRYCD